MDLEAELSDEDDRDSGDELSDESVGSIIDFICDDNVTQHEDVQALYLKTTKYVLSHLNTLFIPPLITRSGI